MLSFLVLELNPMAKGRLSFSWVETRVQNKNKGIYQLTLGEVSHSSRPEENFQEGFFFVWGWGHIITL